MTRCELCNRPLKMCPVLFTEQPCGCVPCECNECKSNPTCFEHIRCFERGLDPCKACRDDFATQLDEWYDWVNSRGTVNL